MAGAVLDGSKVYKQSKTCLKSSPKARQLELPPRLVSQFKATSEHGGTEVLVPAESVLARSRSKRDEKSCGFDISIELEINSVSGNFFLKLYRIEFLASLGQSFSVLCCFFQMDLEESAEAIQAVWTGKDVSKCHKQA